MRRNKASETFLKQLRGALRSLQRMKPGEVHVLSVNASYGRYQLMIGPGKGDGSPHNGKNREIEINGEIHHLFVSPDSIRAHPSRQQIEHNMRDTVIMRDLSIHLVDPHGDGKHLSDKSRNGMRARECINLAGNDGERLIENSERDGEMMMAAYRIVQEDILRALKEKRKPRQQSG